VLLEVLLQHLLLLGHPLTAADPRADFAEGRQIGNCPVAVEWAGIDWRRLGVEGIAIHEDAAHEGDHTHGREQPDPVPHDPLRGEGPMAVS
jgi:hypothetical protein